MSKDSDLYTFVALGAMNPRIHHPKWYVTSGIFSEGDISEAMIAPTTMCTPGYSQFTIGDIRIKCFSERWDIQTANRDKIDKIREIGQRLFDDLLKHTPINVVALNFDYTREIEGASRGFLAEILSDAAKRLGMGAVEGGDLILTRNLDSTPRYQRTGTVAMRSTDDPQVFVVACNYTYVIKPEEVAGLWEMKEFLPASARKDRIDAEDSLDRITTAMKRGASA